MLFLVVVWAKAPPLQFGGIRNQGSTCYMNSILQSFYHVPGFREAVSCQRRLFWQQPTMRQAVNSVFRRLDRNLTGNTKGVTKLLGVDPLVQQDAQEYARLLIERLVLEGADVASLYRGQLEDYIEITPAEAETLGRNVSRLRAETFLDLSVDLYSNLKLALRAFLAPDLLEGDNKWKTPDDGYRSAFKGYRVTALPPILMIHLKRFAFDGTVVKLTDPVDIPLELDGSLFGLEAQYKLHAVVIHVGGGLGGHYYSFVDPHLDGRWLRFDDHQVSSVSQDTVLAEAKGRNIGRHTSFNAYLLQYVKLEA